MVRRGETALEDMNGEEAEMEHAMAEAKEQRGLLSQRRAKRKAKQLAKKQEEEKAMLMNAAGAEAGEGVGRGGGAEELMVETGEGGRLGARSLPLSSSSSSSYRHFLLDSNDSKKKKKKTMTMTARSRPFLPATAEETPSQA